MIEELLIAIQLKIIEVAQPMTIFESPLYTLFAPNFYAFPRAHLFEKNILRKVDILFNSFFASSPDRLTRAVLFATDVDGRISGRANGEVFDMYSAKSKINNDTFRGTDQGHPTRL